MKNIKLFFAIAVAVAAVLLGGCACGGKNAGGAPKRCNVLGLVETQTRSFAPPPPATLAVSTGELFNRPNPSGAQTKLLFGLITITDY